MERVKDPVCGMMVPIEEGRPAFHHGITYYLCSDLCQRMFLADPQKYAGRTPGVHPGQIDIVRRIAYFSMEVAVDHRMPTYSGGLGVLAGDTLRSCADLKIPVVAVSRLHHQR